MLWLLTSVLIAHADTPSDCDSSAFAVVSTLNEALDLAPREGDATGAITFDADWGETLEGTIRGGRSVTILYDPDRASISHSHNGSPAWGVNGYAMFLFPDGTTETRVFQAIEFENHGGHTTNTPIPRPHDLAVPADAVAVDFWFKNWTGADRPDEVYDSNYSANYRFEVQPENPRILFEGEDTTAQPQVIGQVIAGDTMMITYDPERAHNRSTGDGGEPTWGVEASAAFTMNDGTVITETWEAVGFLQLAETGEHVAVESPAWLDVPQDAAFMELWFRNWAEGEHNRYDSSGGQNYRFDVRFEGEPDDDGGGPPLPSGTLIFTDGRPTMQDSLHAGGEMTVRFTPPVDYEPVSADAPPDWGVTGAVLFNFPDGSARLETFELIEHTVDDTGRVYTPEAVDVGLDVPEGATSLEIWTEGWVGQPPEMRESGARHYGFDVN